MSDAEDAEVVRHITPDEAVHRAVYGEINILELDGNQVAVLPASSPWVNGLRTALREQKEGVDER